MHRILSTAALCIAATLGGLASADSGASSASSAGSQSSAALSNSIGASSNSSSPDRQAAAGEYRITDIVAAPGKPGHVRLELLATDRERIGFTLDVPQAAFDAQRLARGDRVGVRNRPYGLEFANAQTREPFFLALADDWFGELDPRPVGL